MKVLLKDKKASLPPHLVIEKHLSNTILKKNLCRQTQILTSTKASTKMPGEDGDDNKPFTKQHIRNISQSRVSQIKTIIWVYLTETIGKVKFLSVVLGR